MALTRAQIQTAFQNSLGRAASQSDENSYFSVSQSGALTDAQIFSTISNSREADQIADPVIRFYQAAFGRVPDQAGLANAEAYVRAFSPTAATYQNLSNMFAQSTEFTNRFGTGTAVDAAYVQALYTTILGRQATSAEVDGYVSGAAGYTTRGGVLYAISQSSEAISVSDTAVNGFQLNAAQGQAVYSGTLYTTQNGQPNTPGTGGSSFNLTTGIDTPTATAGNDTFAGLVDAQTPGNSTLSAADRVNALGGTDTLFLTTQGNTAIADAFNGAQISNLEVLNLRAVSTGGVAFNANNAVGLTSFVNNLSTDAVTVTNLADPAIITVTGNGATTNGATTASYAAAATSADLIVNGGVTAGAIQVNGTGLTSLAIVSNGAANTTGGISSTGTPATVTIQADTALTTTGLTVATLAGATQSLTISGAAADLAATAGAGITGAVNLGTLDADFATVNASGLTAGGISATLASTTATVTGGAGNDFITTGGVLTTGSVNAGAGTGDRLILANTADLGTTALGAKYTNFEQLQVQDGVTGDLNNITGITSVLLNDGAGTTILNNLNATQAGAITVLASTGAATINVTNASNVGQVDTVKLLFSDLDTTLNENINGSASNFTLTGVENLEVTAVDAATITQSAATSGQLSSVTLLGAGSHTFTTGNIATANFSINAGSSTGTNVIDASGFATNGVAITGGTGIDTITGSGQADIINSGAGNDIVTGGVGADRINVGVGTDRIVQAAGDSGTFTAPGTNTVSTTTFDVITGAGNGDILDLSDVARTLTTSNTLVGATAANNTAIAVRGTYDGTANTFVGSATGADTLFTYDADASGATALEAVVLVGYVNTATAAAGANGQFTLA